MEETEDPQIPIFLTLNMEEYCKSKQNTIETNYDKLPLFFNPICVPFAGNHIFSLYSESYYCILNGFYHSGILVLSQILEESLREILKINTDGDYRKSTFEDLIDKIRKKNSEFTRDSKPYLIHPIFINEINAIKDEIRNSYIHMRYDQIFKDQVTPVAVVKIDLDPIQLPPEKRKNETEKK